MNDASHMAAPITRGVEDTFAYAIVPDACVRCGACARVCPVGAVSQGEDGSFSIAVSRCIDCGTCASTCPTGAARPAWASDPDHPAVRASLSLADVDPAKLIFSAGCAMSLYRPGYPGRLLALLRSTVGPMGSLTTCCRHRPDVPAGSTVINCCAGCDRRFRSLYDGVDTISLWEVLDGADGLILPTYGGLRVSVHDSCGYRHKPQVHAAIRGLLAKMDIAVADAELSGTRSVCCGDNLYGHVPNEQVEARIRMRARQLPEDTVVVYCIGCVRAMQAAGKRALYLPDLLLGEETPAMDEGLDLYHGKLVDYIRAH